MDEEFESLQTNSYIQKEKAQRKNPCAFSGAEGETRRVLNPSCSLCEQFILCPFLLRKKTDEEFESLQTNSYIQKEKAQRKNPCAFSGAEGETRRVSNPSCSLCEQFIYVPFCSAKRWTKSLSPTLFALYRKKVPGKIPIPFLAQKERLDGFSTRRVRFANSLFLCPFLLRKKMDEEFESLQTNSYIQKEKAQRKNPCAFSGAEGETRTLAPVTRPTPLAGAPRHQLEYFCIGSVYDTIRLLKERAENLLSLLSGGESGIRTHGTLPYDGFQDRSVITTSVSLRIR